MVLGFLLAAVCHPRTLRRDTEELIIELWAVRLPTPASTHIQLEPYLTVRAAVRKTYSIYCRSPLFRLLNGTTSQSYHLDCPIPHRWTHSSTFKAPLPPHSHRSYSSMQSLASLSPTSLLALSLSPPPPNKVALSTASAALSTNQNLTASLPPLRPSPVNMSTVSGTKSQMGHIY